jgi:hypothetical protein
LKSEDYTVTRKRGDFLKTLAHIVPILFVAAWVSPAAIGCSCAVTETARLLGSPRTAEEIREDAISENTRKLKATVTMDSQEYFSGQDAQVRISIVNATKERLEVWEPFEVGAVSVMPPVWQESCSCGRPPRTTRWIDAGEIIEATFLPAARPGERRFGMPEKPGDYQLLFGYGAQSISFRVVAGHPTLLSISGDGRGQGAILHPGTSRVVSAGDPARAGEALEMYATGLLYGCPLPRELTVGGQAAAILYFGKAQGLPGKDQVNVQVPSGIAPGPSVRVHLTCGNGASNEVTIGVQ